MEENINILMANFEENLEQLLIESHLPVGIAYYLLKDQTERLHQNYIGFINSCRMKQSQEEEELQEQETENNEVE